MKYLILLVCLVTTKLNLHSQASDSVYSKTMNNFMDGYNNQNFALMRECFGGPLKLIFNEKRLGEIFGSQHDQMGNMHFGNMTWKSSIVKGGMFFERDTTEQMNFGFSFSEKGKIIGMSNTQPRFKYKNEETQVPTLTDIDRIDSLVRSKHELALFSGCVAVYHKDAIIYENCYGRSSYPDGPQLTPSMPFEIASCSKAFTAAAIAILEQQGKLKYSDPIVNYIPELKKYKGVTVEQLLWHNGGIPDYMELFEKHWDKSKIARNKDVVAMLAKYHPKKYFKAGEKHEYSNTGYVLLAAIAERITGEALEKFMQREIFDKAGMKSAFLYNHRRTENKWRDNYAYGYILDFRSGKHQLPDSIPSYDYVTYLDGITGDGMVNINVQDMIIWDRLLREPGILTQATIDRIFTSGKIKKGEATNYGFGWEVQQIEGTARIAEHSGSWPGYTSYVLRFLDEPLTVVIFSNNEYIFMANMAHRIAKLLK